jgi:hypothetical protein
MAAGATRATVDTLNLRGLRRLRTHPTELRAMLRAFRALFDLPPPARGGMGAAAGSGRRGAGMPPGGVVRERAAALLLEARRAEAATDVTADAGVTAGAGSGLGGSDGAAGMPRLREMLSFVSEPPGARGLCMPAGRRPG